MPDRARPELARRAARLAAGRLAGRRWVVAAALLAIVAVQVAADGSGLVASFAALAVVLAAALAPGRPARRATPPEGTTPGAAGDAGISAETLAAAVPDPLVIFDNSGSLVHANAAARAAFGALDAGMSLLLKFRAPEMQEAIQNVMAGQASVAADHTERFPIERVFRVTASAIGRGTGLFVLVFKDQSEARRIDRMRADFIANASHELRTPLASIAGFIETLRGPARNDPAAREHFLQIMQGQTGRMARLIDDLLSLSRLEMKPYLDPAARVDLKAVLGSVIDSLALLAAESGVVVERHFPETVPAINGDRDELFQVFQNLFENACKYGASGGRVVVSIENTVSGAEPEVAVSIRDFGPGIAEEHIPRITERFYRVDVQTSRAQKGTGLGLSIVKHILTRHKGRLTIRSSPGEGATFTVHLPQP